MTYDSPTTVNMSKGFGELLIYLNNVTGHWISNMLLLGIWIIILVGVYKAKDDFAGALAISGWATFVVTLLFWAGGFATGWALSIAFGLALIGVIVILTDSN